MSRSGKNRLMFAMDEAKLPPPTPVRQASTMSVAYDTPGSISTAMGTAGTSSSSALTMVQFRPPNRATASV